MRGLHYDIENGYLMKIDQFQQIQMGSIYKGLSPITYEEVKETYGSRALPLSFVEAHLRGVSLVLWCFKSLNHWYRIIKFVFTYEND